MATDKFDTNSSSQRVREEAALRGLGSARRQVVITPDDDTDLDEIPRAIRFNAAGDVAVVMVDDPEDADPVIHTVAAGETVDWRVRLIAETGTDIAAGKIVALY
jgi:hypothetical protein